jgi:hypothetical protein
VDAPFSLLPLVSNVFGGHRCAWELCAAFPREHHRRGGGKVMRTIMSFIFTLVITRVRADC